MSVCWVIAIHLVSLSTSDFAYSLSRAWLGSWNIPAFDNIVDKAWDPWVGWSWVWSVWPLIIISMCIHRERAILCVITLCDRQVSRMLLLVALSSLGGVLRILLVCDFPLCWVCNLWRCLVTCKRACVPSYVLQTWDLGYRWFCRVVYLKRAWLGSWNIPAFVERWKIWNPILWMLDDTQTGRQLVLLWL